MNVNTFLLTALLASSACGQVVFDHDDIGLTTLAHDGEEYLSTALRSMEIFAGTFDDTVVAFSKSSGSSDDATYTEYVYNDGVDGHIVLRITSSTPDSNTYKCNLCVTNLDPSQRPMTSWNPDRMISFQLPADFTDQDFGGGTAASIHKSNEMHGCAITVGSKKLGVYLDEFDKWSWTCPVNAVSGTTRKLAAFWSNVDGNESFVLPHGSTVCSAYYLRWGSSSDTLDALTMPGILAWREVYPQVFRWADRRPLVNVFISGAATQTSTNPRRYHTLGIFNPDFLGDGFADTRQGFLNWVENIALDNADLVSPKPQAVMVWDLEGNEFPHVFTYVGYPGDDSGSKLAVVAPEMETETAGVPLVDELFNLIRARGYEPGITLRPTKQQHGTSRPMNGCYRQSTDVCDVFINTAAAYPNRGYECRSIVVTFNDTDDRVECVTPSQCSLYTESTVARLYCSGASCALPGGLTIGQDYYMCNYDEANGRWNLSDSPSCTPLITDFSGGSGSFTFEGWRGPLSVSCQALPGGFAATVDNLRQKSWYAYNRWGIKHFYVDSTAYCFGADAETSCRSGKESNPEFWRDLAEVAPPGALFIPENVVVGGHPFASKYLDGVSLVRRQVRAKRLYPDHVALVNISGAYDRPLVRSEMQQGVLYEIAINTHISGDLVADYAQALSEMRTLTMTDSATGTVRTFRSDPGGTFKYPLKQRVYFASSSGGLAESTTYCEMMEQVRCYASGALQSTAQLDLSTMTHYSVRYYDFAGRLVQDSGLSSQLLP